MPEPTTQREDSIPPRIALDRAIFFVSSRFRSGPQGKPGEVIEFLSRNEGFAEAIRNLRSDDLQDLWRSHRGLL